MMDDKTKRMLKASDKAFNMRVERERKWAKRVGLEKKAGKGSQGPYYVIETSSGTKIRGMTYPPDTYDTMDHVDFWKGIAPDLVQELGITDPEEAKRLDNMPYCMRRGRVVSVGRPRSRQKQFIVYHGIGEEPNDQEKKAIIEEFGLSEQFHAGLVRFAPDEHETRLPEDVKALEGILGTDE